MNKLSKFVLSAGFSLFPLASFAYTDAEIDSKINQLNNKITNQKDKLKINGFMSLSGGKSNEPAEYQGVTDKADWESDSVVGVQFDFYVNDKTRFVTQLKGDGSQDFNVNAEWAFLKYDYKPNLVMRAGRLRYPAFLLSEYIDAAYAYPWAKSPVETYDITPFNSYEGFDLIYTLPMGNWNVDVQPYGGSIHFTPDENSLNAYGSPHLGIDTRFSNDNWTFRIGMNRSKISIDDFPVTEIFNAIVNGNAADNPNTPFVEAVTDSLATLATDVNSLYGAFTGAHFGALGPFAPPPGIDTTLPDLTDPSVYSRNLDGIADVWTTFLGLGIRYEDERIVAMTEFNSYTAGKAQPDLDQGYVMVGYRFGSFLPHVTFSRIETTDESARDWLDSVQRVDDALIGTMFALNSGDPSVDGLAAGFAGTATGYNATLDAARSLIGSLDIHQETVKLGVRWDAAPAVAIKFEVEEVSGFEGTSGLFNNSPTSGVIFDSSDPDKKVNVFRASVDVLF